MKRWLNWRRHINALRGVRAAVAARGGSPDLLCHLDIITQALYARKPHPIREHWNMARATALLMRITCRATLIWSRNDYPFLANMYPLEWRRAVTLWPDVQLLLKEKEESSFWDISTK